MEAFFQDYGLLIAVATPVAVVVAMQALLFISGERGTLLLPSLRPFESIMPRRTDDQFPVAAPACEPIVEADPARAERAVASNEEREAA
jgi:hypothetical protein